MEKALPTVIISILERGESGEPYAPSLAALGSGFGTNAKHFIN